MSLAKSTERPPTVLLSLYNAIPSVFWSLLGFVPISVFWLQFMNRQWLYSSIVIALLAYLIPASQLRRLESRRGSVFYRQIGVPWANSVAQNGTLVNRFVRRRDSRYRRIQSRSDAVRLLRITYVNERFHWAALVFFLLSAAYAAVNRHLGWTVGLIVINVFYNLYPIWLQQYMRIRLERYVSRSVPDTAA